MSGFGPLGPFWSISQDFWPFWIVRAILDYLNNVVKTFLRAHCAVMMGIVHYDIYFVHIAFIIIISYFIESNPVGPRGGLSGDDGLAPEGMGPWAYHTIHCQEHHCKIQRNTQIQNTKQLQRWKIQSDRNTQNYKWSAARASGPVLWLSNLIPAL